MALHDISRTIAPGVAVYEGDDPLGQSYICDIGDDAPCRITKLENWTTHFLTHIDVPRHFIKDGDDLDAVPLSRFCGRAIVVTVEGAAVVESDVPDFQPGLNILFRTSNSGLDNTTFHRDHAFLTGEAVTKLIRLQANLVGFDYLSVDCFGDECYPAHRGLLEAGVLILEGLDLHDLSDGPYELWALPLKIGHADGSPVRAVLLDVDAP